mgnify:CR=1 FL=1
MRKVYIIASIKGKGVLESDFLDAFFALENLHITIERRSSREKYRENAPTSEHGTVEAMRATLTRSQKGRPLSR